MISAGMPTVVNPLRLNTPSLDWPLRMALELWG